MKAKKIVALLFSSLLLCLCLTPYALAGRGGQPEESWHVMDERIVNIKPNEVAFDTQDGQIRLTEAGMYPEYCTVETDAYFGVGTVWEAIIYEGDGSWLDTEYGWKCIAVYGDMQYDSDLTYMNVQVHVGRYTNGIKSGTSVIGIGKSAYISSHEKLKIEKITLTFYDKSRTYTQTHIGRFNFSIGVQRVVELEEDEVYVDKNIDFFQVIDPVVTLFKTEFTIYGFTFSLWQVFLFSAVGGVTAFAIRRWLYG